MLIFSVTDLLRGKLETALGIVRHRNEEVLITRYGEPIARLVPLVDASTVVSDPTASLTGLASPEVSKKRSKK